MKGRKCDFCEYDYGPMIGESGFCVTCENYNNFKLKSIMHPAQAYGYMRYIQKEMWLNDLIDVKYDRRTALAVLNALSEHMYPSHDLFGNKTLVIDRDKFEVVRKKFLDRKGESVDGRTT